MKSEEYEEETHHTFQAQKKTREKNKQEEYREKTRREIDEPHRKMCGITNHFNQIKVKL
jgi:hypothetical protein